MEAILFTYGKLTVIISGNKTGYLRVGYYEKFSAICY